MEGPKNLKAVARGTAIALTAVITLAGIASAHAVVVAKVNGQSLTDKDIRLALSSMNDGMREKVLKDPSNRQQILNSLIDQEVLVHEATVEKLDQDQQYKDAMELFRKQYLSSRALQKNLGAKMTEAAVKKYYNQHRDLYSTDAVHAMHILVGDLDTAREVLKLAKAKGADFQALAVKYSKDPSVKNNRGDLGVFGRNAPFDRHFMKAVFDASKGEVVGPVKTAFGYHIIKVVDKKLGKPLAFDDVELRVKQDLSRTLRNEYVSRLKAQAKIQINKSALDHIE